MNTAPQSPRNNGRRLKQASARFVRVVAGIMLIVLGLLSVPTPLPIGFVLSIVGLAVLAAEAAWIASATRWLRGRVPAFSAMMETMGERLPAAVRRFIDDTRPEV